MKNLNLQDKKVAVLGMGMEGLALVDFLINKECALSALDKLSAEEIDYIDEIKKKEAEVASAKSAKAEVAGPAK